MVIAFTQIKTLGIYGIGLLGGSLGLALKQVRPDIHCLGIGRSETKLQRAVEMGAIDEWTCDVKSHQNDLDALVVCTPVRLLADSIQSVLGMVKPNGLITDVGSTKATVAHQCEDIVGDYAFFVGSHPMAGSHKSGAEAAQADLYLDRVCVVTQTDQSELKAVCEIESLWKAIGMQVVRMSPEEHDQLVASSSHLPHLTAAALCHVAAEKGDKILAVLGSGFRDSTRIAEGDPSMWLDICLENSNAIRDSLDTLQSELQRLSNALSKKDSDVLLAFLQEAQEWKKRSNGG